MKKYYVKKSLFSNVSNRGIYVCMYEYVCVLLLVSDTIISYRLLIQDRVVYINISWEQLDRYSLDYYFAKDEEYKTVMKMCGAMEIIIWPLMKTSWFIVDTMLMKMLIQRWKVKVYSNC